MKFFGDFVSVRRFLSVLLMAATVAGGSLVFLAFTSLPATAQTEIVLYSFTGKTDGCGPSSGLVADNAGILYGVSGGCGKYGWGIVFKLIPPTVSGGAWTEKTIYQFTGGADGGQPISRLVLHAGSLFGVTDLGGSCTVQTIGCGVVFRLTPPDKGANTGWTQTVLHTFSGGADGLYPLGAVTFDSLGNLYGTTIVGGGFGGCGPDGCGVAYELTAPTSGMGEWSETILYAFGSAESTGVQEARFPQGSLVFDQNGALYGAAEFTSINGFGASFKLSPPGSPGGLWKETVLYAFQGGSDGVYPLGGLVFDHAGALYGVTENGGSCTVNINGCGLAYKLTPPTGPDGTWTKRTIYTFGKSSSTDGQYPAGTLTLDSTGNLYGTTYNGGNSTAQCVYLGGCGTVYKLTRPAVGSGTWTEAILHNFTDGADGGIPYNGGLLLDSAGNVYGTASQGGITGGVCYTTGCGVIFEITP